MNDTKHTPTPWRISAAGNIRPDDGTNVGRVIASPQREQDAAFIVRACNSHQALVDALEKIVERSTVTKSLSSIGEIPTAITAPTLNHAECIEIARAALALAKQ